MAPYKAVKVLEQCQVAPPPGSVPSGLTHIPLTFFDQLWLPLPPPQILFFYDYPYPTTHFTQFLLPHIKLSLSSTLIHFYPLAGKLSWPHDSYRPIIRFISGDSLSLTIAESDADFNSLSGDHARHANESHPLVPHLPSSGPVVPLLAIQVTLFPNSGFSIGTTTNHSFIDGRAYAHFMLTWALISKLGDPNQPLPFLDRTVIKDPNGIEKEYLNELDRFIGSESVSGNRCLRVMDIKLQPDMFRATFELNPNNLKTLKDWIHVSTYMATCAFVWVCVLKAEAAAAIDESMPNNNMTHSNRTQFVMNVDCRGRVEPQIPATYFGNCIRPFVVIGERSDLLREDGIVVATQLIEEAIRELDKGVLRGLENGISDLLRVETGRVIAAAGSPRFGLYRLDFGWGKPKKMEFVSNDITGSIFMKESRNLDGGVEIDLALNKKEMDVFASVVVNELKGLKAL
ncbi:phenolic glucoside malonyltransferase 1-like [Telopea speciosissima]|uniref:phenolic glucoside malonyltransferase 1-like n=1 Tax=Telopea speciosissima TaxID=54955 RepID=UPI001CC6C803|nr:phenolic glucoside malonyltransferase 1-like [Telopea speciosissima]